MPARLPVSAAAVLAAIAWTDAVQAEDAPPPAKVVGQFLEKFCLD